VTFSLDIWHSCMVRRLGYADSSRFNCDAVRENAAVNDTVPISSWRCGRRPMYCTDCCCCSNWLCVDFLVLKSVLPGAKGFLVSSVQFHGCFFKLTGLITF